MSQYHLQSTLCPALPLSRAATWVLAIYYSRWCCAAFTVQQGVRACEAAEDQPLKKKKKRIPLETVQRPDLRGRLSSEISPGSFSVLRKSPFIRFHLSVFLFYASLSFRMCNNLLYNMFFWNLSSHHVVLSPGLLFFHSPSLSARLLESLALFMAWSLSYSAHNPQWPMSLQLPMELPCNQTDLLSGLQIYRVPTFALSPLVPFLPLWVRPVLRGLCPSSILQGCCPNRKWSSPEGRALSVPPLAPAELPFYAASLWKQVDLPSQNFPLLVWLWDTAHTVVSPGCCEDQVRWIIKIILSSSMRSTI